LAGLCLLWLYGRIVPFYAGELPDGLIALVDGAFLPLLALQLTSSLLKAKQARNLVFIGLLLLMITGNVLMHLQLLGCNSSSATLGLRIIIAAIILMILVITGRVLPFFTERGLPGSFVIRNPQIDLLAWVTALLMFVLQAANVSGTGLALAALAAAGANGLRLFSWYVPRIWYVPLLWVLYLGYSWIIIGFILTAFSAYNLVTAEVTLHAFTVGGIGVLTLGMMARVALGHTGRALKASTTIAVAFGLLNAAAFVRTVLPAAVHSGSAFFIYAATLLWLATFALFIRVYLPILSQSRIDGQEG
jgi:uncharacterized protein involved in response to NO